MVHSWEKFQKPHYRKKALFLLGKFALLPNLTPPPTSVWLGWHPMSDDYYLKKCITQRISGGKRAERVSRPQDSRVKSPSVPQPFNHYSFKAI
jgi:hypothetical protein